MGLFVGWRRSVVWLAWIALSLVAVSGFAEPPAANVRPNEFDKHRYVYGPPPLVRPGHRIYRLPAGYHSIRVRRYRDPFFYHHGVFYRPHRTSGYIVVTAPLGARVRHLPPGHVSFWLHDRHYFYVNMTYYRWDDDDYEYVVVKAPDGAIDAMVAASSANSSEVFVYPAHGQSDEQRDRDRYECYLWSVNESGYDPAGSSQDFALAGHYRRALMACLEGRGYTVK